MGAETGRGVAGLGGAQSITSEIRNSVQSSFKKVSNRITTELPLYFLPRIANTKTTWADCYGL